jgi:hypothetical protein
VTFWLAAIAGAGLLAADGGGVGLPPGAADARRQGRATPAASRMARKNPARARGDKERGESMVRLLNHRKGQRRKEVFA